MLMLYYIVGVLVVLALEAFSLPGTEMLNATSIVLFFSDGFSPSSLSELHAAVVSDRMPTTAYIIYNM